MSEPERIDPDARHALSPGLEVLRYGMPHDWRVPGLTAEAAEAACPGYLGRLEAAVCHGGWTGDVYMPNPSRFDARVSWPNADWKYADWHVGPDVRILRGPFADGVVLDTPNQAFAITSADCPTLVLWDPEDPSGRIVAAHAGRDSLIDRSLLRGEGSLDNHDLIREMMQCLGAMDASRVRGFIVRGIGPEQFGHPATDPLHGEANARMTFFITVNWGAGCFLGPPPEGRIRLDELIRCQLAKEGVDRAHVLDDGADSYADVRADGQPRLHSHRRDGAKAGRDLIVVRRI